MKIGTNSNKTNPRYLQRFADDVGYCLHAETAILHLYRPGDAITVVRFSKQGQLTMARPCIHCQKFLKRAGVTSISFSNWLGEIEILKL